MKSYTTIVIGGGPAGLAAAIFSSGGNTLLLEKNAKAGLKLLIAGSGRCNITHDGDIGDFTSHYGDNGKFLKKALREFTNINLIRFFEDKGLLSTIDKNGKVFPATEKSKDVLNVLLEECKRNNITILSNRTVTKVSATDAGFLVTTNENTFACKYLVIATGGRSYPTTGSTGDGYEIARSLGHSIVAVKPALTPVFVKSYAFESLAGVSLESVPIYLYKNGKKTKEHRGDIGLTHKGISGPGIIDFSRFMDEGDLLRINFANQLVDSFRRDFIDAASTDGRQTVQAFLRAYDMPKSLMKAILDMVGIMPSDCISNVNVAKRSRMVELFCEFPFEVERLGGFKMAMATAGGILLEEVSSKTMESKIQKNLFFVGEVLDIDGDTGGYNIQAAFSTGFVAGKVIATRYSK